MVVKHGVYFLAVHRAYMTDYTINWFYKLKEQRFNLNGNIDFFHIINLLSDYSVFK